jgi:hypothetical protein
MDFIEVARRDNEVDASDARRTVRNILLHKIGTIYMIHPGQTITRNTSTAKSEPERSENGRTDFTPIERLGDTPVILKVTMNLPVQA